MSVSALPLTSLTDLYPAEMHSSMKGRASRLTERFAQSFGSAEGLRYFSAPGRTEIGGNHTDHQQGRVLAAAVSLDALAAAAPNGEDVIRVYSEGYPEVEISIQELSPRADERGSSSALIRGLAEYFSHNGRAIGGFNAVTANDVPGGSGLSSSAAFEVLIGSILCGLFNNGAIPPVEIAKAGQYAENEHFGKPCGLMDQTASAVGGVAAIDFQIPGAPVVEQIPFDFIKYGYALCIIDTGVYHNDLGDEYASIPMEMSEVAGLLGKSKLREIPSAEFERAVPSLIGKTSDRAILRAMHFFADNDRAAAEAEALKSGDVRRFLELVNESGHSSWMLLQNICPTGSVKEQPASLALAFCEKLLAGDGACRIHGGGFAGTVQAFVPIDRLETFRTGIEKITGKNSCRLLTVRNIGASEIVL